MQYKTTFKDLIIWKRSMKLVRSIYQLCELMPNSEQFGLCNQMKRASVSIPSNIAEGFRRTSSKEFVHFLRIACGSCAELETQTVLVSELFDIDTSDIQSELIELQKMISAFIKSLK